MSAPWAEPSLSFRGAGPRWSLLQRGWLRKLGLEADTASERPENLEQQPKSQPHAEEMLFLNRVPALLWRAAFSEMATGSGFWAKD